MNTLQTEVLHINPNMAKEYLATMEKNHSVSKKKVEEYAETMRRKEWMMNGEAIVFDKDNKLVNGQHRLIAVIKSGMTVPFLVVKGVDSDCFLTYDSGKKRTAADAFDIEGVKNAKLISSVVRKGCILEDDRYAVIIDSRKRASYTKKELLEKYNRYCDYYDWALKLAISLNNKLGLYSIADIGAVMSHLKVYLDYETDDIEHFFKMLFQYKTTSDMNCLSYIRDKIVASSLNGTAIKPKVKQNMLIMCWNLYKDNRDMKRIPITEEDCKFE